MAAQKKNKTQPPATVQNFPVVGIGASAGGLDAFKRLLAAIPENSGMAYVLVQHLDPSHESYLPEILQRVTKIPVYEITEDIHLAPDHIYIIPSNKMLTSTDGVLQLSPREKKKLNLTIDVFFTSIADVHKECAVGIVLSGTGTDGTLGLKAIKEHGGISIAQDTDSAAYNGMPQSAVNAGVVDFILAPEKIPEQLLKISSAYKTSHVYQDDEKVPKDDEEIFKQILLLLNHRSGVDFSFYKRPTFYRRIARRIAMVNRNNLSEYLKFLRSNDAEQDALFQDVLIPVTSFFRDPKTFQNLSDTVIPALFKDKSAGEPIRVWIAGCSTGEEAFSIAICLHEFLGEKSEDTKIQIFASDISEKAIRKARAAIYTKAEVENISETYLKKYFVKINGSYELRKLIRDMCVFAAHNFLKDPPFAKMDLISCRNVLIYMDTFLQKKALTTFHYALKEKGFLLLGKSETIGTSSDLFSQFVTNDKIYSRKPVPGRFMPVATERKEESLVTKNITVTKQETVHTDFRKSAEQIMILKAPVSVVVNEQMDIVHIHGDITAFLQQPQGKPTHNLMKMAREGLSFELRNAIHKAKSNEESVIKEGIPVKSNGEQSLVTIEITPLINTVDLHYLIQFEKKIIPVKKGGKKSSSKKDDAAQKQYDELEKELSQTREDMRSITEDMEAANEELQSANEELQSSNEEMQSLNEELETSREELQSTNEELTIVNQELLDKQSELNAARYYAESIVTTIREPLIVLDKKLRIKTANESFYKAFKAEETDTEGKLFYEIQNHQWDDDVMRSLLEKILPEKERLTDFEIILKFPSLGERNMLMNARQIVNEKTSEQLILLAIEDVTERKLVEEKLKTTAIELATKNKLIEISEAKFRSLILQAPVLITAFKGPSFIVETINNAALEMWGKSYEEVINKPLFEVSPEVEAGLKKILNDIYTSGEPFISNEIEVQLKRTGKPDTAYFNSVYQPLLDLDNKVNGIILIGIEVTETVNARKQIEASEKRFSNILSQSLMAIAIFKGPDMVIAFANEPMLNNLGKGNTILNKPLLEGVPELKDQAFPKLLAGVYTTGVPFEGFETKAILIRNGIPVDAYFNFVYQPYRDVDDTITGITVLATEVTEQVLAKKQIEESNEEIKKIASQLKLATDAAKVGVWSYDIDSSKLEWSNIHKIMWGYDEHREDLTYEDWYKVIVPEDKELALQRVEEAKVNHGVYEVDYRISRANDGAIVWIKSTGHYQYDEFDQARTLKGISIDITKQKSFTEELEKKVKERTAELQTSNEELKQTNLQLDQFAHIASHDLQEPLRKIITFSMLLQDKHKEELSKEVTSYLNKIEGASSRMSNLIRDLLHYSRLLQPEKSFVQTDLNETLKNVLNDFEMLVHEKKAKIKIAHLPTIDAIPLRMNQLFQNLMSNALKFSKAAIPPVITITSRTLTEKQIQQYPDFNHSLAYVEIIFKDNGIGFEQQYADKIFTIFQRLHSKETYIGTGIGLSLCKKIIENHHGEIFADAKENEGALFHIILPLKHHDK